MGIASTSLNMGCGGSEEKKEEMAEESADIFIQVWVSADADSPNFLIKTIAYEWMTVGHVKRRVNEVLAQADSWEGDGEFCIGLSPQWAPDLVFNDEDMLIEVDGWGPLNNEQAFIAHTENFDNTGWGDFDWAMSEEVVVIELLDPFDPYE